MFRLSLISLLLIGCATSLESVEPRAVVETARDFNAFAGCIGEGVKRLDMQYYPTAAGGRYFYEPMANITGSVLSVELVPGRADVYVKGGPWLGKDDYLIEVVESCA